MKIILHITSREDWEAALSSGFYRSASLDAEGFIHCSTLGQTVDTADRFFPGRRDLVLLCIDEDRAGSEVRYEGPASDHDPRMESRFPHIYGPLNVSAVVRVVAFVPDAGGHFALPAELGAFQA
ncbi:DUF952 domain-containing protein [Myxococcota bacterium]|nr:DUF952 domain-containing protein [Myxococcota bacterium]